MEWLGRSAAEQGRAIAAGALDPVRLAESALDAARTSPDGPRIFARMTPERALAEARAAHDRARAGMRRGPLDGVPVSWKDNVDTAGIATEAGSRLLAGRVPERDAAVLATATEAGLVCIGKTHLSELAFSGLGVNPMAETAPNSRDDTLAPGGSSSGAAASVALGMAAAAVGSDTGGSVRIPAAWNGLVGLKTTAGLIPTTGVVPLAASLDTVGPLTRTVEDAVLMLAALTGTPMRVPAPATGLRLQMAETVVLEGCDTAVRHAFEMSMDRLDNAGIGIAAAAVPEFAGAVEVTGRLSPIVNFEGWQAWGATIEAQPGVMWAPIEARFRSGAGIAPEATRQAREELAALRETLVQRIAEGGMIVMPTVACMPPPVARLLEDGDFYAERNLLALRNTRLANLLGLSAITLPTGHPSVGISLLAGPMAERELLAAALTVERALKA